MAAMLNHQFSFNENIKVILTEYGEQRTESSQKMDAIVILNCVFLRTTLKKSIKNIILGATIIY